jgi:hypothetical protein
MIYAAIFIGILAIALQMQASAWHRGLMANASIVAGPACNRREHREWYVLLQPRFVQFRSNLAFFFVLMASCIAAVSWQWWSGIATFFAILAAANVLSRLLLPNGNSHYWMAHCIRDVEPRLRTALMGQQTEVAWKLAFAVADLRSAIGAESRSPAEVIDDTFRRMIAETGGDPGILNERRAMNDS